LPSFFPAEEHRKPARAHVPSCLLAAMLHELQKSGAWSNIVGFTGQRALARLSQASASTRRLRGSSPFLQVACEVFRTCSWPAGHLAPEDEHLLMTLLQRAKDEADGRMQLCVARGVVQRRLAQFLREVACEGRQLDALRSMVATFHLQKFRHVGDAHSEETFSLRFGLCSVECQHSHRWDTVYCEGCQDPNHYTARLEVGRLLAFECTYDELSAQSQWPPEPFCLGLRRCTKASAEELQLELGPLAQTVPAQLVKALLAAVALDMADVRRDIFKSKKNPRQVFLE